MGWATKGTSDALTLDGNYDTVLESSSTKTWSLKPEEFAAIHGIREIGHAGSFRVSAGRAPGSEGP